MTQTRQERIDESVGTALRYLLQRGDVALVQQEVPPQHAWHLTCEEDKGYEVWRYAVDANGYHNLETHSFGISLVNAIDFYEDKIKESKNA